MYYDIIWEIGFLIVDELFYLEMLLVMDDLVFYYVIGVCLVED